MQMKYLLDTHTWVWWHMNSGKLSQKVKDIIMDVDGYDEILLSAISPWEFCKLLEKKGWESRVHQRIGWKGLLICQNLSWSSLPPLLPIGQHPCPSLFTMIRLIRLLLQQDVSKMRQS